MFSVFNIYIVYTADSARNICLQVKQVTVFVIPVRIGFHYILLSNVYS